MARINAPTTPNRGTDNQRTDFHAVLDVASHQQTKPAGQIDEQDAGHMQVAVSHQIDWYQPGADRSASGQACQIAGDRRQRRDRPADKSRVRRWRARPAR